MAIKTFTTSEVLTAADTNTYLANSGLVFVKQQAITGTPTSVEITNAFSTTYDNYRITVTGITPSAADSFRIMIGSGRTDAHYGVMNYNPYSGAAGDLKTVNANSVYACLNTNAVIDAQFACDIQNPFLSQRTFIFGQGFGRGYYCDFGGVDISTSSYTSFTIKIDGAGTMSGGTVTVHGYRKS
jgi:hypothetical protein